MRRGNQMRKSYNQGGEKRGRGNQMYDDEGRAVQRPVHPIQSKGARALGGPGLGLSCQVFFWLRAPFKLQGPSQIQWPFSKHSKPPLRLKGPSLFQFRALLGLGAPLKFKPPLRFNDSSQILGTLSDSRVPLRFQCLSQVHLEVF